MSHPSGWYKFVDTKAHFFDNDETLSICGTLVWGENAYEVRGEKRDRCKHCVSMVSK
jgi:hypothetical protein